MVELKLFISIITLTSTFGQNLNREERSATSTLFKLCTGNFGDTNTVENSYYFPEVEYPLEVLDVVKPFYYRASTSILEPFPKEVRESFAAILSKLPPRPDVVVNTCDINEPKVPNTSCTQCNTTCVNLEPSKAVPEEPEENVFNDVENEQSEYVTAMPYESYECEELYKVDGIRIISEDD